MAAHTITRIRLTVPDISFDEVEADLRSVIDSGWLTGGRQVAAFESAVAQHAGTQHAAATSSGTTALQLALLAVGVQPGDEVIVPDYTFPATANAVIHCGARPVTADVHPATYNLDPESTATRITPRTRAIMPVHQFGLPADMAPLRALAAKRGLALVEDAACALGARYHGSPCGSLGDTACFSFHPRKLITTGEGGAVTTNSGSIDDFCRLWRNHGMATQDGHRTFVAPGFNFRMDEMSAVLGNAQLRRLGRHVAARRTNAARLTEGIRELGWLTAPAEPPGYLHTYQSYVVVLAVDVDRQAVIAQLAAAGVEATTGAASISAQPYFKSLLDRAAPPPVISDILYRRSMSLPLYAGMDTGTIDQIVDALRRIRT